MYYATLFNRGYCLTPEIAKLQRVLLNESTVSVKSFDDKWVAYNTLANDYIRRFYRPWEKAPLFPPLAYFETDDYYHRVGCDPASQTNPQRYFIVISATPWRVALMDRSDMAISALLNEPQGTRLIEVNSLKEGCEELQKHIAYLVYPYQAYFDEAPFPFMERFEVNIMHELPVAKWFVKHCVLPADLQRFCMQGYAKPALGPAIYPQR